MAATTESVKTDAAEAPLLNKRNMFAGAALICSVLRLGSLV